MIVLVYRRQLPQFDWGLWIWSFWISQWSWKKLFERCCYFFKRAWQKISRRVSKFKFFSAPTLVTRIFRATSRTSDTESENLKMFLVSCCSPWKHCPASPALPSISCHVRLTAEKRWQKNCWTINLTKICHDVQREWKETRVLIKKVFFHINEKQKKSRQYRWTLLDEVVASSLTLCSNSARQSKRETVFEFNTAADLRWQTAQRGLEVCFV